MTGQLCYNSVIMKKTTGLNKQSILIGALCYVIWGFLPLYWHLLEDWNPLFVLCNRILFSAVFVMVLLLCLGRVKSVFATMRDWSKMKYLLPAAIVVTINWGIYIWAVSSGRVIDSSLGYYMNPLMVFVFGVVVFREKSGIRSWIAIALAAVGVLLSTLLSSVFPYTAVALALTFSIYGLLKKIVHVDGLVSIAVETLLIAPFALLFILFAPASRQALMSVTPLSALLLIGTGIVTATPLILYTRGVNDLPFVTMGFLQFICPTLQLAIGLIVYRETLHPAKIIAFAFIWLGLVLYMSELFHRERTSRVRYRQLGVRQIRRQLFRRFERKQVVERSWRKVDQQWTVQATSFVEQWDETDYAALTDSLRATVLAGGVVFGAFAGGQLKGFAAVDPRPFGAEQEYLDLAMLHVSEEKRHQGIGKALFYLAADWARARGAKKLYLSTHSAVETQAFYQAIGCREAAAYDPAHVEREPCDCQLEFVL